MSDPCAHQLEATGFSPLHHDSHDPIRLWHRPAGKRGLITREPMHSLARLDLLGDSPTRFLELALEAARAVDQMVVGGSVSDVTGNPTLEHLSAMMTPWLKRHRRWRHPQHRIAIVMDAAQAPSWAEGVLPGCIHDHPRRCAVTAIYDERDDRLLLPPATSERVAAIIAWLRDCFASDIDDTPLPPPRAEAPSPPADL